MHSGILSAPGFLVGTGLALVALCGLCAGEPLPKVEKERVRGSLDGYELLHVYPEIQYPDTVPSPLAIDWKLGPDMPLVVKGGVAGVVNNHLVVVPGIGFRQHDAVVQALDLKTMKWTGLPRVPKPPVYTTGVRVRDSIIVLSGRGAKVGPAVQRLRFAGGKWVWDELPPLPSKTWYTTSACADARWLVISNGNTGRGEAPDQVSRHVWALDLNTLDKGWQTVARYEHGVLGPMLAGLGGKVYFFGGCIYYPWLRAECKKAWAKGMGTWSNAYIRQKYAYALDLKTRKWTRCADMPYSRSGGVALAYKDRYILIFGGSSHSRSHTAVRPGKSKSPGAKGVWGQWLGHHDEVLLYDTVKNAWSVLDRPMPYGMNDVQATIHGDTVYVTGGEPNHWFNFNTEDVVMIGTVRATRK